MINKFITSVLPLLPKKFVWAFSKRYISGKNIDDAVVASHKLAIDGISVTLDHLGEYISELSQAEKVRKVYLEMIDRFEEEGIQATYSLKPSSFGLHIDFEFCFSHILSVVEKAHSYGSFVRIDMEDSSCVDAELELYRRLHELYPLSVGIVIQAYLKRTPSDLEFLARMHSAERPVNVRLCKGIYVEPESVAIKDRKEINVHFLDALDFLFRKGIFVGIATHDRALTDAAQDLIQRYSLMDKNYEFQMLYGVTPELRRELLTAGHKMRVYVPFGKEWFGYSTRRLKENPRMAFYIIKALFYRG
jgi:proline dehydrogenase